VTTDARALARRIVADVFDIPLAGRPPDPAASSEAQLAGRRIVAEILAERPPEPPAEEPAGAQEPGDAQEPAGAQEPDDAEEPGGPEVAARMVAEVLGRPPAVELHRPPGRQDRSGDPEPGPPPPDPTVTQRLEEDPPARTGRWVLVTLAAAIGLAVLFPLAIRALLQLLSMS